MDEQMQQQIVQLVQAAMQGDQQAQQQIMQVKQAAEQGDQQAAQLLQVIMQIMQQMQGGAEQQAAAPQMARKGAKLDYIKNLLGQCPEGYELKKFAKGGRVCSRCVKAQQEMKQEQPAFSGMTNTMSEIKQYLKKGGDIKSAKCGKKVVKDQKPAQPLSKTQPVGKRSGKPMPTKYNASAHDRLAGKSNATPAQKDSADAYVKLYNKLPLKEQERIEFEGRARNPENPRLWKK